MSRKILITGAAGFIGKHIAQGLGSRKYELFLMVRPGTSGRLGSLIDNAEILEADLRNIKKLKELLNEYKFTDIIHTGAIRNRQGTPFDDYLKANIQATEQLILHAMKNNARFIYFSSVGIFGTVPEELPPSEHSKRQPDNNYHYSKIESERLINKYILYGLNAVIIRPTITYGPGDTGFPYLLIDMIKKGKMFIPSPAPMIHLGNVELLVQAVQRILESEIKSGTVYNIGDSKAVNLQELADFISSQINPKKEKYNKKLPLSLYKAGENFFKFLRNTAWQQRFKLFNSDWYYDVEKANEELNLKKIVTIPGLRSEIEWYKKVNRKRKT